MLTVKYNNQELRVEDVLNSLKNGTSTYEQKEPIDNVKHEI